ELLTGRPPFREATAEETREAIRTREPLPPRHFQPGLPPDLEGVCLKCLRKEPDQRYVSAQGLADDLQRFLEGEAIQTGGPDVITADLVAVPGYDILEELGRGSRGIVYKAWQPGPNRIVALRILPPWATAWPPGLTDFLAAARVAADVRHPNLVQVFE